MAVDQADWVPNARRAVSFPGAAMGKMAFTSGSPLGFSPRWRPPWAVYLLKPSPGPMAAMFRTQPELWGPISPLLGADLDSESVCI